ncbi:snf2 family helicase ATPase [Niveomyces insectorum RCEF 264]|uniref:Chromatin-remodeling ATPase INO80 n=1 Tax=Niveomyces insectorum RCEF 264 TaxID=1081102 RepID=A0A167Y0D6_9HYPO|nr:snf2 family helicase ATPase [Niveomyces insectorum RCEF 264]
MEPSNSFHSTVLGRSHDDNRNGDRRRAIDILNREPEPAASAASAAGAATSSSSSTSAAYQPHAPQRAYSPRPHEPSRHSHDKFILRSPIKSEFYPRQTSNAGARSVSPTPGPPPAPVSSVASLLNNNGSSHHNHNHPPPPPPPPSATRTVASPSLPTRSPLLPVSPVTSTPYSGHMGDAQPPQRDTASGSFYDPTTDKTTANGAKGLLPTERRLSDPRTWRDGSQGTSTPQHRDAYGFPSQPPPSTASATDERSPYYNLAHRSPTATLAAPRSPVFHSRKSSGSTPAPAATPASEHTGDLSNLPPPRMASPSLRQPPLTLVGSPTSNGVSTPALSISPYPRTESPAPSKAPPPASTPKRTADLMSFSNILSSAEPAAEKPKPTSPPSFVEDDSEHAAASRGIRVLKLDKPDKKRPRAPRRVAKPRVSSGKAKEVEKDNESVISEAPAVKASRRSSTKLAVPEPRVPAKRAANGQQKKKLAALTSGSAEKERSIQSFMNKLDEDAADVDASEYDEEERAWKERFRRRKAQMALRDAGLRSSRRTELNDLLGKRLEDHSYLGTKRYYEIYYDDALQEVREQELFAEKERKKDMQRKRRREKSMAVTLEQKNAALARAALAEDEHERQKLLREAERANKKAQQTKLILQKGIKGPVRNVSAMELNLEGGTMSTFQAMDLEPGKTKGKGRGGSRPKKSKEQKQQEKDNAEAAQAALDAGEALPSRDDTSKIRIKFKNKSGAGGANGTSGRDDGSRDTANKENAEPKLSKGKEREREKAAAAAAAAAAEAQKDPLETKFQSKGFNQIYDQIWRDLARKDVSKTFRLATDSYSTKASNLKKTAFLASKEAKRWQLRTNKGNKDLQARAKRVMRDMMTFWKRNEREERDQRKAAERQELENARKEEADREAARQKRKLNFLISQTELYSHFIGKKIKTDEVERSTDHPDEIAKQSAAGIVAAAGGDPKLLHLDEPAGPVGSKITDFENLDFDAEDESHLRAAAMANAQNAIAEAQHKARQFNNDAGMDMDEEGEMNFQNPTGLGDVEIEQPKLLNAQLKEYQLKGLNWLVNLYEQGINGILADEMGLGKTVQSISVMAYLAEKYDIWGPFLVVAPASTLHNWQQEINRFVPEFKVLPYWGSAGDRKVLRKFWDRKHSIYKKNAQFHVLVTSYQLVVADVAFMSKMRWQYMILDEAQAIKSSQSSRWKVLLNYHCRNRLLLTGTPIQNNMQELWALLHFIMPSLFDSHDEFSEWFSKDIESHAQSNTKLNEDQLKRLHMILKPFMLRRVKKHVQKELGDKIELDVFCNLTYRQRAYYANLRNQISIMDLIEKATLGDDNDSKTLMNLVMQFRKVCNHPDLFERAETASPFVMGYFAETASFSREGTNIPVIYSSRSTIEYELPRLVASEDGRLQKASRNNPVAGFRSKYLDQLMNVWTPENVRKSADEDGAFSWLRFADTSPGEAYRASHNDVFARSADLHGSYPSSPALSSRLDRFKVVYDDEGDENGQISAGGFTPAHALFQIRERNSRAALTDITREGVLQSLMNVARATFDDTGLTRVEAAGRDNASAPPIEVACSTRSTVMEREELLFNVPMRRALYGVNPAEEKSLVLQRVPLSQYPPSPMLPAPDVEKKRFNNISVPSMRRFVTDSGKLAKLDELLFKLKEGGHRVLLYFQMTRMIDLMEEYLTYRNYKYCRLDGSTKLEDRRDTVHDFQTRPDIFIFLLSTRAGGLGINLTSADTVIFYDSDWNPTIDSQAMDRAHRLGQTRQVTVYRLITRGTIEERIRKRALQKEEVQRVVIQGGGASSMGVDFSGRRAQDNRNRDIALWLADDEQAEMIERREKELLESGEYDKAVKKRGGGKRKRNVDVEGKTASLDDMYHEGEGNFDDNKLSGTATPVDAGGDAQGAKKKRLGLKKAKTTKQRLAIADGLDG